jgi:PAS domain S-box-containing protein
MRVVWANAAACRALNMNLDNFVGQKCHELWHHRSRPCGTCHVIDTLQTGLSQKGEINLPNGSVLSVSCYPIYDRNQKIQGIVEVAVDTTDRKQVQEALKFTQFAVDHAADAVFWLDSEGRIIYVNHASCNSLGYSCEELLSMTVHDVDPQFAQNVWAKHWAEIKKLGSFTIRSEHRRKDGQIFPVEVTGKHLEFGGKEYHCSFARDISTQLQAENALIESEEKYRLLVENANDAIYIIQDDFLRFWNRQTEKMLGYTAGELAAIHFTELIHPDDRAMVVDRHYRRLRGENPPSPFCGTLRKGRNWRISSKKRSGWRRSGPWPGVLPMILTTC